AGSATAGACTERATAGLEATNAPAISSPTYTATLYRTQLLMGVPWAPWLPGRAQASGLSEQFKRGEGKREAGFRVPRPSGRVRPPLPARGASVWERVGVRGGADAKGPNSPRRSVRLFSARPAVLLASPHPNPLPKGEGTRHGLKAVAPNADPPRRPPL